ncbi:maleylpyruvate isomerase family mycothiol-dependent enzyme [Sanguibacter sp. 25GB23B1]|uniref:maleylpyruvate isomerase family mycothiol-dependent enzyme n=1 Tax=unclassified Sanguibacter TaxID=2645534 RepID=UPI0032AFC3C6
MDTTTGTPTDPSTPTAPPAPRAGLDTLSRYEAANRPLTAVLDAVAAGAPDAGDAWSRPSPCEGWAARDVVRHLVETQRDFLARHDLDAGDAPDIDRDPAAAWTEHSRRVLDVLADPAVPATAFDGHFGPTTIGDTFSQFYVWDMIVHRWDVATAAGLDAGLTDAELDAIDSGAESFGEALHMDGICKPAVDVDPTADRATRALARLGRRA